MERPTHHHTLGPLRVANDCIRRSTSLEARTSYTFPSYPQISQCDKQHGVCFPHQRLNDSPSPFFARLVSSNRRGIWNRVRNTSSTPDHCSCSFKYYRGGVQLVPWVITPRSSLLAQSSCLLEPVS
jgi:hypothetical protein